MKNYYDYLRGTILVSIFVFAIFASKVAFSQATIPYSCTFETTTENNQWTLANGTYTNKWAIGTSAKHAGTKGLYITNNTTNTYTTSSSSYVYAYRTISFEAGCHNLQFYWKGYGESTYDFLRVFIVPTTIATTLTAGTTDNITSTSIPLNWIDVSNPQGKLNLSNSWTLSSYDFTISSDGNYLLVFYWENDGSAGTTPPAAVDDISITKSTSGNTITFNTEANCTGTVTPNTYNIIVCENGSLSIPNGPNCTDQYFAGWSTNAAGTGTTYYSGETYTPTGNTTLYAQYSSTGPDYCTPELTSTSTTSYIKNFTTANGIVNINNTTTGTGGSYSNFSSISVGTSAGSTLSFTLTSSSTTTFGCAIWIDWNQDGDFNDAGEVAYASTGYLSSPVTGTFTVPTGASFGTYRMRIATDIYDMTPDDTPCEANTGEFEDYSIIIPNPDDMFTLQFDATNNCEGATGAPANITWNGNVTLPTAIPSCNGQIFTSWNTNPDGSGDTYLPGETFNITENDILYAQYNPGSIINNETTIVECGTNHLFFDSGGQDGNYTNSENLTHTFKSCSGKPLTITFNSINVEDNSDEIYIGDGNGNVLNTGNYYDGLAGLSFTSNTGTLSIKFTSDGSIVNVGWEAVIKCPGTCDTSYINCNTIASGTITSAEEVTTCSGLTRYGNLSYIFIPTMTGEHTFFFDNTQGNPDFFINGPDIPCGSLTGTTGTETYTVTLTTGLEYFILATSSQPNVKVKYELAIDCPTMPLPCLNSSLISCGGSETGTLPASGNSWLTYPSCTTECPGGEKVYVFNAPQTGTYNFTATSIVGESNFAVMTSCGNSGTNLAGSCWTNGTRAINMEAGTSYYIIVDNTSSTSESSYSLSVECPNADNPCCNLNMVSIQVNGTTIQQFVDGYYYVDLCLNNSAQIKAINNGSCNLSFSWRLTSNGTELQTSDGTTFNTMTFTEAKGYDLALTVKNTTTSICTMIIPLRIRISKGIEMIQTSDFYACAGEPIGGIVSATNGYDILVDLPGSNTDNTLGVGERVFLPDGIDCGSGCSYISSVTFTDFAPTATVQSAEDIDNLRINIEHSFGGDIYIGLRCPNGQTAAIMKYGGTGSSDCIASLNTDQKDEDWAGITTNETARSFYFGDPIDNEGTDDCDSTASGNEAGIGWNYVWSENDEYSYADGEAKIYETLNQTSNSADSTDVEEMTNVYKPDESFTNLIGCPLNGEWQVTIIDAWNIDNGYVFNWELTLADYLMPGTWAYSVDLHDSWVNCNWVTSGAKANSVLEITPPANAYGLTNCEIFFEDDYGCITSSNLLINVNPYPTISPITNIDVCSGSTIPAIPITLTNQDIITAAGGVVSYSWTNSNPAIGLAASGTSSTIPSFTITSGTATISIEATYSNGGKICSSTSQFTISTSQSPEITGNHTVCQSETLQLNSNINGGTWSITSGTSLASISTSGLLTPSSNGTVEIVYTANSCPSEPFNVEINSFFDPTFTQLGPYCQGDTPDALPTTSENSITGSWSPSTINTNTAGTTIYTFTADAGQCSINKTMNIVVNPLPTVSANASDDVICEGESTSLTASGATSYSWSTGSTTNPLSVSPTATTTYTVTGTSLGCSNTANVNITVNPIPTVNATAADAAICNGSNTSLTASGATTYTWSTGSTTNPLTISPTATTTYTVTGTSLGCSNTANVSVTVNPIPTVSASTSAPAICEGSNATLTASGATTYTWSIGSTTNPLTVSPTTTTTYTVTGTSLGCSNTASVSITVNPIPTVSASASAPTICEGSSSNLTASGATTYTWSTGSTTNPLTVTPNTTTTYTVTGTSLGCSNTANVSVTVNPIPNISISASDGEICLGENTTLTASGATTYTWSTGSTTNPLTISPTTTTTYTVTGTTLGCSNSATQQIIVNPLPTPEITNNTGTTIITCTTTEISLTATGGNTYAWSNGINTANNTINSAGNYIVTVTSAANCSSQTDITITNDISMPEVTITASKSTICDGETVTISANGANTYLWSPGGETSASITVNPHETTTYSVLGSISDCNITVYKTITVNPIPTVTISTTNSTICDGANTNLTANGATTYTWDNGSTSNTLNVTPNTTTTYAVIGTSLGCSNSASQQIVVNPIPTVSATATNPTICDGSNTTLTASGATTYSWSTGSTTNPLTVSPTTTTTYTVTGTSLGCSNTANVSVTVNPIPNINISVTNPTICEGSSTTLTASGATNYVWNEGSTTTVTTVTPTSTATYTVVGTSLGCSNSASQQIVVNPIPTVSASASSPTICNGSNTTLTASGATTYTWSTGSTTNPLTLSPNASTTYTVTGTSLGCSNTANVSITVNPIPTVSVSATNTTLCNGDNTTLTANGANSYVWSTGATTNPLTLNPNATTTYTVTGTSLGCSNTANINITVNPIPAVTISTTNSTICDGSNTVLTANGATTYTWDNGSTSNPLTVTPNTTTTYTVVGTSLGCSNSASQQIVVNPIPTVSATATNPTICDGSNTTLTASGATTYSWSTGSTANPLTLSPNSTTTYTVTGTSLGCSNTANVSVTVNPIPNINISATNPTICEGSNTTLTASGATNYVWNEGSTTATITLTPTSTATYTVVGTSLGCSNSASQQIVVNPIPTVSASASSPTICNGSNTTLTASGATTYTWSTGSTTNPLTLSPNTTTTYTVTGTSLGCSNTANVSVTVNPIPTVSVSATNTTLCNGDNTTLTANGATSYVWSTGATTNPLTLNPNATTTYTVSGTSLGCTNTANVNITVNPIPTITISATNTTLCNGSSTTLTANGATNYVWSTGSTTNPLTQSPNTTTTYAVTGTSLGCSSTANINITVNPIPTVTIETPDNTLCMGENTTLTANGATTYSWSTGSTTNPLNANPTATTTYTVTGTSLGCSNTASQQITVNQLPNITANASPSTICIDYSSTISAEGGTSYTWNTSDNTNSFTATPTTTTTYVVSGTDANNCSNSANVTLTVLQGIDVNVTPTNASLCEGESVSLQASSPATSVSYTWNNGETTSLIQLTPSNSGLYIVTGIDALGCKGSDSTFITVNPLPIISLNATPKEGCIPLEVYFTDSSTGNTNQWLWNFGDGGTSTQENPTYTYNNSGSYDVTLSVTTAEGCSATLTKQSFIKARPNPNAAFTFNPPITEEIDPTFSFTNLSTGSNSWHWLFGDEYFGTSESFLKNPTYSYSEPGTYTVILYAENSYGCIDSAMNILTVKPSTTLYMPNVFTPNDDGVNDVYYISSINIDPDNYEMMIFDRWGELVFQSKVLNEGWDGKNKRGKNVLSDVYTVVVNYKVLNGEYLQKIGSVTVIP